MWCTTDFSWQLTFNKALTVWQIALFEQITWERWPMVQSERGWEAPDSYCQWEITGDWTWIERDGCEKFYMYEEWLNYLEQHVFRKWGIILEWEMQFQWEEVGDSWIIKRNKEWDWEAIQIKAVWMVCCPECWHKFLAEEWEIDEEE